MFCHKSFSFRVDCNKGRSSSRRKLPPPVGATPLPPEATSLQCKVTTIIHFLPFRVYFYESNRLYPSVSTFTRATDAARYLPLDVWAIQIDCHHLGFHGVTKLFGDAMKWTGITEMLTVIVRNKYCIHLFRTVGDSNPALIINEFGRVIGSCLRGAYDFALG